jgi:choline kinase
MNPRAIILAAGGGTRLRPMTEHLPKCLVPVNGIPIIENAMKALSAVGCARVSIVVGHNAELLRRRLGARFQNLDIDYLNNDEWNRTNSMFSLHLALERGPASYVLEGDVFFEPGLLPRPCTGDVTWLVDGSYRASDGCYLRHNSSGCVTDLKIVKAPEKLTSEWAKSIGILCLNEQGALHLREWLAVAVSQNKLNHYYDLIIAEHLDERTVWALDVAPAKWWEIDNLQDLRSAEGLFL